MAQRGRGLRLALGAHGRLALARDHLQRDVEAALLVAREPDVAHPSRAERPQRSVPSKDELLREGSRGHPPLLLRPEENSFPRRTDVGRFGHGMDPRDDDIQFDFFEDEPATSETRRPSRVRLPRRGGSNGDGGAVARAAARRRAAAAPARLVAVVVGVVLLFGVLIKSCASSSRTDSYASYMDDVQQIASAVDGERQARRRPC